MQNRSSILIGDLSESNRENTTESDRESAATKNPAAVALGRLGGLKGGRARAAKLSAERRSEIASIASRARWRREE